MVYFEASKAKESEIYQISDRAWRATQHFFGGGGEPYISDHAYTIDIEYNKCTRVRILDILILKDKTLFYAFEASNIVC